MPQSKSRSVAAAWSHPVPSRTIERHIGRSRPDRPGSGAAPALPARILIVEDEALIALDLERMLADLGYRVCGTAPSAGEAVAAAERLRPDLVLMDIHLKDGSDGVLAAIEIRSRFNIPAIYLTAQSDPMTHRRAELADPLGFVVKPFTAERIGAALRNAAKLLGADAPSRPPVTTAAD